MDTQSDRTSIVTGRSLSVAGLSNGLSNHFVKTPQEEELERHIELVDILENSSAVNLKNNSRLEEIRNAPLFTRAVKSAIETRAVDGGQISMASRDIFPQYGLIGYREPPPAGSPSGIKLKADRGLIYANMNAPWSAFICGSQGAGKSHTFSCLLENALLSPNAGGILPDPLTGIVFHYDNFTSYTSAQLCEAAFLCSVGVSVQVLVSPSNIHAMERLYSNLPGLPENAPRPQVRALKFHEDHLNVGNMKTLMAVDADVANPPLYLAVLDKILRDMAKERGGRPGFDYANFKRRLYGAGFTTQQLGPLELRLQLLEEFLDRSKTASGYKSVFDNGKGSLTIVDLSCPFVDGNDACALFSICLSLFLERRSTGGRIIALDEAHKFLTQSGEAENFTEQLISIIRQQRHLASRVVISTQEPTLSPQLLELCNVTFVHRFRSPRWLDALKNHIAGAANLKKVGEDSLEEMFKTIVGLRTGEALVFSPDSLLDIRSATLSMEISDMAIDPLLDQYAKVRIRNRISADGGKSIMASDKVEILTSTNGSKRPFPTNMIQEASQDEKEALASLRKLQLPRDMAQQTTPRLNQSMTPAHLPRQPTRSPSTSSTNSNPDSNQEPTSKELEDELRQQTRWACENLGDGFSFSAVRKGVQAELDISFKAWKKQMHFMRIKDIFREEVLSWSRETGRPVPAQFVYLSKDATAAFALLRILILVVISSLNMAHFLRGKQAGVQGDLSNGVAPDFFVLDDFARYGVNSQISVLAYDPIQSLLAVGTKESQFGAGLIYVYGQKRVCVTFKPARKSSLRELHFCADKLIALDSKNDVSIFDLDTRRMVASYAPPGHVVTLLSDPSLDYCFIGLQNGDIVAYDLDRGALTPFKIPNCWRERNPRARVLPVVSMQLHPRDVGSILIGYAEGAVIFSVKQNKAIKFFHYEVPKGAAGGDSDPATVNEVRYPRLTHCLWHPTGTFILTAHEDSSLVFWDPRDGRVIEARTITDTGINLPGNLSRSATGALSLKEPYFHLSWCSKENPDDTGLLISGGSPTTNPTRGLTFFDFGPTPVYATSSWDLLTKHFQGPKRTHVLSTPPNAEIVTFLLIPRTSPHFNGSNDPIAVLTLLSSGELVTLSFPSGHPITPTNQLHLSLSLVHPFVTKTALTCIDRTRWLGMREVRQHGPNFLLGGAEEKKALKRFENRNVVQIAHADGTIRVWDAGHGDEIENSVVLQVDLAQAVGRWDNIQVAAMSMSGANGELSVGLVSGEVAIFRLNRNPNAGRPAPISYPNEGPGKMTDISKRADPGLKEGLLPLTLTNDQQGPVTALKHSDVGFVAVGYDSGGITIMDMRGPAIIHTVLLSDVVHRTRRGSIRGKHATDRSEWATTMDFGVMTMDGDDYSSILLFVGTSRGRIVTFKILPSPNGRYSAQFAGAVTISEDRIISISPMDAETGKPAYASGAIVAGLKEGRRTNGVIVVVATSSVHIFKPAGAKGASKSFDQFLCDSAVVARFEDRGHALVGLFGDGYARAYSLPALKEVGRAKVNHVLDVKRFGDAIVTPTGDIFGWTGPSELALLNVWGAGMSLPESHDKLYDPVKMVPPRPTISNLQWIAGTQYITPADMDTLIGGPGRPPSKRAVAEMREQQELDFQRQREAARTGKAPAPKQSEEGYYAWMQRQIQERTENLGLAGDSMDRTAEASASWSDDVSKFVAKQKRQAALGLIGSKFGL